MLRAAAEHKQTITLGGNFSKRRMAGPIEPADVTINTAAMRRVLSYEPRDLTISVETGMPWCELTQAVAANRQMIPLDPPFADRATVANKLQALGIDPSTAQHRVAAMSDQERRRRDL